MVIPSAGDGSELDILEVASSYSGQTRLAGWGETQLSVISYVIKTAFRLVNDFYRKSPRAPLSMGLAVGHQPRVSATITADLVAVHDVDGRVFYLKFGSQKGLTH